VICMGDGVGLRPNALDVKAFQSIDITADWMEHIRRCSDGGRGGSGVADGYCECVPSVYTLWAISHIVCAIRQWCKRCSVLCSSSGHHGQLLLSGAMVATGRPMGSLSHVASQSTSEAGRWRCLWNISSQLICPTFGMIMVLGSAGACGRRMLRSVGSEGQDEIVFGCFLSTFLHADKQLRRGSRGLLVLRFCVIACVMFLIVV
jgi:hypothetical protein